MSKNSYFLTIGTYSVDGQDHVGYGIGCHKGNTNIVIEDIALESKEIVDLISRCNTLNLSPIHFYDIVEDFLTDNTI